MVSAASQRRSRPSGGPVGPPAKRAKHNDKTPSKLESIVFGKDRKPLTAVTSNGVDLSRGHVVNQRKARVGVADEGGDVVSADILGSKRSVGKRKGPEAEEEEEAEESESEEDDEDLDEDEETGTNDDSDAKGTSTTGAATLINGKSRLPNGHAETSSTSSEEDAAEEDQGKQIATVAADAVTDGPSFGELANIRPSEPIDIETAFAEADPLASTALNASYNRSLSAPSATSLATVLTQAIRTNDRALLETCFQTNDLDSIRSTIERLPSQLVAALLQSLAERMHRTPGRASILMVWVQWSLVAHGGYLASNAQVVKSLKTLHRVIKTRAESLQRLLPLKGRLDLVAAQMELRRSMAQRSQGREGASDEEGDAVIYIEGAKGAKVEPMLTFDDSGAIVKKANEDLDSDEEGEEDSDDEAANRLANGFDSSAPGLNSSDEEESDEDGLGGGLIEDEAESTDNDDLDDADLLLDEADVEEDEEEGDEVEEDEDESESESEVEVAPKLRRSNAARLGGFAV